MIKEHEQITLNDFEAQYQVILGNIRTSNKDLEQALEKKKTLEKELSSLGVLVADKRSELKELEKEVRSKKSSIESQEKKLLERELKLSKSIEDFDTESFLRLTAIKEKESNISYKIADKLSELDKLNSVVINLNDDIKRLDNNKQVLSKTVTELGKDLTSKIKKLEEVKEKLDKETKDFNKKVKVQEVELEYLNKLVLNEKDKIESPRQKLAEEEAVLNKKKRNFEILVDRFKKHYKKLYPNQEIKL